jgi:SAM-dependent methyltransferase
VALDASPHAVRHARAVTRGEPWVSVVRGDTRELPFAPRSVDVVHAGQFLHHIPRPERAAALASLLRLPRTGGVVSDLLRLRWAYHGVRLFGAVTRRRRFFRHDGPASIARAFTPEEAEDIARATAIPGVRVRLHPFARLTWSVGPYPVA